MTDQREKHNGRVFITANALQNVGDQITAAKTVLPWIFAASGVPPFFTAFLVPVRESGSMLPQAALTPWILSKKKRAPVWIAGSLIQALSAIAIGLSALWLSGMALGIAVIAALAVLSLGRSLCSITSKDVQGRTISKGARGALNGKATSVAGLVGIAVALLLIVVGDRAPQWILAALIVFSGFMWFAAGLVFRRIDEPEGDDESDQSPRNPLKDCVDLVVGDPTFRRFVTVRSLLLVTALSSAFIVALGTAEGASFGGAGSFMLAAGLAGFAGGTVSGKLSDISSRTVMSMGSLISSIVIVATVIASYFLTGTALTVTMAASFFLVSICHVAVRVARKTYVVDMAEGAERTRIVGAANTIMGVVLLAVGAASALISLMGNQAALLFLAALGIVGTWLARTMKEVSHHAK